MNEAGEPSRMLGVNMDITERKQAEEALSGMTRKLVEAQEEERARIARELHDDINQRLAMLVAELEQLQHAPLEVVSRVQVIQERIIEIAKDPDRLPTPTRTVSLSTLGTAH